MSVLASVWPLKPALPAVTLEGSRVTLRPPQLSDWHEWRSVREKNEPALRLFEPTWPEDCLSRAFFKNRLKRQQWDWEHNQARFFLIRLRETDSLIGGVNINYLNFGAARHGWLGYWLDAAHQGKGLMAESLRCVMQYGFQTLGLQRLHAACIPENEKSMRVLRRLGFIEEGFAKAYLQINGVWHDHYLFGMTRADYLSAA